MSFRWRYFAIVLCVTLMINTGCNNNQNEKVINSVNDSQGNILNETERLVDDENKDDSIQELNEQLEKFKNENNEYKVQINNLENEKRQFIIADRFGRMLYQAMVFGDVEQLAELTKNSDLQVFANRFEQQVGGELVQISFNHLQTETHMNNQVILKTNGYGLDDDLQVMRIHYTIIAPERSDHPELSNEYFLNVNLMKTNPLEWTVIGVEFDI